MSRSPLFCKLVPKTPPDFSVNWRALFQCVRSSPGCLFRRPGPVHMIGRHLVSPRGLFLDPAISEVNCSESLCPSERRPENSGQPITASVQSPTQNAVRQDSHSLCLHLLRVITASLWFRPGRYFVDNLRPAYLRSSISASRNRRPRQKSWYEDRPNRLRDSVSSPTREGPEKSGVGRVQSGAHWIHRRTGESWCERAVSLSSLSLMPTFFVTCCSLVCLCLIGRASVREP